MSSNIGPQERWIELIQNIQSNTPYLLTDLAVIRKQCQQFKDFFPQVKFYYAIKAYSDAQVIQTVDEYVDGFDAASIGEIEHLLSLGISPQRIAFNNPVKPVSSIKHAYEKGVRSFAFQSQQELGKLIELAPGSTVVARVKMDDSHSAVPLSTKYGCDMDEVGSLLEHAKDNGLIPGGVTFHVGSQQTSFEVWLSDIANAKYVLREANRRGLGAKLINIGGGFPAQYSAKDPAIEDVAQVVNHALGTETEFQFSAEPGRFVVANSSAIVATVIGRERRNDRDWLYLDVGLFQAFIGAARFHPFPYPPFTVRHGDYNRQEKQHYTLTGPSCDSQDIIANDVVLPADVEIGDRIVFPNTGAYTVVYGSEFNGFTPPGRIFIDTSERKQ